MGRWGETVGETYGPGGSRTVGGMYGPNGWAYMGSIPPSTPVRIDGVWDGVQFDRWVDMQWLMGFDARLTALVVREGQGRMNCSRGAVTARR